jgi:hypothetical protein
MVKLVQLYIDDSLPDELTFGKVREQAFAIIPKEELLTKIIKQPKRPLQEYDFYWQTIDTMKRGIKSNLRCLVEVLGFSSITTHSAWLEAIKWIKAEFHKPQRLAPIIEEHPEGTIPVKLLPYFTVKEEGQPTRINKARYEFWVYRQLDRYLRSGGLFLEDSLQYRSLNQELVSIEEQQDAIQQLNIPGLRVPIAEQLDLLLSEQHSLLLKFNKALRKGKLKHLRYDEKNKTLHWQKIKVDKDERLRQQFYCQLPLCDITDVLRFVDKHCAGNE